MFFCIFIVKLETGDGRDLKFGVFRIIGSGATVQSVFTTVSQLRENKKKGKNKNEKNEKKNEKMKK